MISTIIAVALGVIALLEFAGLIWLGASNTKLAIAFADLEDRHRECRHELARRACIQHRNQGGD
jgi:hypothetical protein